MAGRARRDGPAVSRVSPVIFLRGVPRTGRAVAAGSRLRERRGRREPGGGWTGGVPGDGP